jgi:hypothetical protein
VSHRHGIQFRIALSRRGSNTGISTFGRVGKIVPSPRANWKKIPENPIADDLADREYAHSRSSANSPSVIRGTIKNEKALGKFTEGSIPF